MAMDVFIKIILGFLLFFTPFAFAGTEPWAFSILQGGIVVCWVLLLCVRRSGVIMPLFKPVLATLGGMTLFVLLQTCFPKTLLDPAVYYPVSLMRLYGWEHASLFVTYLAVTGLTMQLFSSQASVKKELLVIVASALAVALCAVSLPKGDYIFQFTGVRGGVGPFLNRNHASVFFAMGALIALGLFFTRLLKRTWTQTPRQKYAFYIQQFCLFAAFAGLATGTVLTRSRGGMLSLLVGIFCYAFLCVWAVPQRLKKRLKGIFITLIAAAAVCSWIFTHLDAINAFAQRGTGVSTQTRTMLYRSAYRALGDHPVWGIGVGAMPVVITSYVEWKVPHYIERLHNDWLEILLGVGYGGGILIAGGLLWFIWLALRRLKRLETRKQFLFASLLSALVVMCVGSTVDFHFFVPANALVFFVLLGLCCAPTYNKHHVHTWHWPVWGKSIILLVLALSLYVPTVKTLAWRCVVFGSGFKTPARLAQYERAVAYYPSPRYALRLGNAYFNAARRTASPEEKQGLYARALEVSKTYLRRYPRDKELSRLYVRSRARLNAGKNTPYLVK